MMDQHHARTGLRPKGFATYAVDHRRRVRGGGGARQRRGAESRLRGVMCRSGGHGLRKPCASLAEKSKKKDHSLYDCCGKTSIKRFNRGNATMSMVHLAYT